ncbi:GH12665 [Drosophila grimshawi]|uniref:GH12665 n=1 Tax=Drosophila grimshawi TaxID=7222 RepID=B4JKH9_DROGR|nr:GH12665 [Drosophila grimshawi]
MTPFDDFIYLINHVLLGEEPTIEDFILLVGTLVAFIAFILWCCFPIQPKEPGQHRQFTCRIITSHIKAFDKATNTDNAGASSSTTVSGVSNLSGNSQYNSGGTYSKSGTVAMHNYYVKSGHHCCT